MFVSVEGIDYSGKTTVVRHVHRALVKKGYEVKMIRAPGQTFAGQAIRRIVCGDLGKTLTLESQVLLFLADFIQTYDTVIFPALSEGEIVISDRWVDSTFVYQVSQASGLKLERRLLQERLLDTIDTYVTYPDLTVILDVTVDDALRRKEAKNRPPTPSQFEEVDLSVWDARVKAYRDIPRNDRVRNFVVRDGGMPLQGIVEDLVELIYSTYENRRKK
jgi:dTMP kinase